MWADNGLETIQNLRFAVVYVEEPLFIYIENTYKYKGIVTYLVQALVNITHSGELTTCQIKNRVATIVMQNGKMNTISHQVID